MVASSIAAFLALTAQLGDTSAAAVRGRSLRAGTKDEPAGAWTPPPEYATGTSNHKTMYLADISVGGDGQSFRMLVDTGSSLLVVPSAECKTDACSKHQRLSANGAKATGRTVSIGYGMGSLKGRVLQDKVCLASPDGTESLTEVGFLQLREENGTAADDGAGCTEMALLAADEESDDFGSASFDGILGLGLTDPAVGVPGTSLLDQLHESGKLSSTEFALRLSNGQSELVLGGVDEHTLAGHQALWVPLSPVAATYWQFSVLDIAIDGKPQQIGNFDVAIDSGTSLIAADAQLKQFFMQNLTPKDCDSVNHLPKVTLQLTNDISLPLLPSDYVDRDSGECKLALMPGNFAGVNYQRMVLGDSFMRRYVTIFDRENRRIGFGVNGDDQLANQMLPNMFPAPTTTPPPATTSGEPPPANLKYDDYQPVTTPPPPTPEEEKQNELNNAFSGLPDVDSEFQKDISSEEAKTMGHPAVQALTSEKVTEDLGASAMPTEDEERALAQPADTAAIGAPTAASGDPDAQIQAADAANPYMGYLKLIQVHGGVTRKTQRKQIVVPLRKLA